MKIDYNLNRMLYTICPEEHTPENIKAILEAHHEVRFISLTGVDMGNHNTDEKIPVKAFLRDINKILTNGVQTDGSSVALPTIADLSNARVDIVPDLDVNWYVEYNFDNINYETGLPTGTLRIPSFLMHNGNRGVCSRTYLKWATSKFESRVLQELKAHPYVFNYVGGIDSYEDIERLVMTNATELEFWVKTPDDRADRDQLSIAQELKEQYWKRVTGPVATAMEQTIEILERYGFGVEMGHKEVGGVKAKMGNSGSFDHIMEQLEIDWKYASPMQAADNESQIKNIVRDVFRTNNLEVTFLAKPMHGVAGSGEHTHFGLAAELKNGNCINLFEPTNNRADYMSPIGYGALMGILRRYEMLYPIVAPTHDAFQRLKPGYEAPVCVCTSLGINYDEPSRNRTILIGLVRNLNEPMSTRFELRSPNPHTNTYLIIGATYLVMLDGIHSVLENNKTPQELEKSISKNYGEKDFYLERDREYRSERNIYTDYSVDERAKLFGEPPANVWQCFKLWEDNPEDMKLLTDNDETAEMIMRSYRVHMTEKWSIEYHDRYIINTMQLLSGCAKLHNEDVGEYDLDSWRKVCELKNLIGREEKGKESLLMQAKNAIDEENYNKLSELELLIEEMLEKLRKAYDKYRRNIF